MPKHLVHHSGPRPVDPRARQVEAKTVVQGPGPRRFDLTLSCGHTVRRKLGCPVSAVICEACPAAGGLGGGRFASPGQWHAPAIRRLEAGAAEGSAARGLEDGLSSRS